MLNKIVTSKPRILIADGTVWCNALTSLLRDGYSVTQSTTQEEAEHQIQTANDPYHVVLVDINLPGNGPKTHKINIQNLLERILLKNTYTITILLISSGFKSEQIRNLACTYKIPLRRCVDKFASETFDYKKFLLTVAESVSEAVEREEKEVFEIIENEDLLEEYTDFELHIGSDGHIIATSIEGEAKSDTLFEIPDSIKSGVKIIEAGKNLTDEMLKGFGQELYKMLFPSPIHAHLHQTEAVARAQNTKTRIRLRIENDDIASLPLEFVYRKVGGYFLAQNPNTVLSRYLHVPMPSSYVRKGDGPLNILTIIANPSDQAQLDVENWQTIMERALRVPIRKKQVLHRTVKHATFKEIRAALMKQKPNIIQFIGHGIYDTEEKKGYLALVDSKTDRTWKVDDNKFADMLLGYDDYLGLVGLATCESAKSDSPDTFLGIAPKIVQRGIPAVVAMNYKILVRTAELFLENFYESVAARKPIDWAVQAARNAISIEMGTDNREFATPVLYMRAKNGKIF